MATLHVLPAPSFLEFVRTFRAPLSQTCAKVSTDVFAKLGSKHLSYDDYENPDVTTIIRKGKSFTVAISEKLLLHFPFDYFACSDSPAQLVCSEAVSGGSDHQLLQFFVPMSRVNFLRFIATHQMRK